MVTELNWLIDPPEFNVAAGAGTADRRATLILAHGAGAPMDSHFMNALSGALVRQGLVTLRFEFPYMAARRAGGRKGFPDAREILLECWRQVIEQVKRRGDLPRPLLIGGKSMGGRLATMVADTAGVEGVCCFGYPFLGRGKARSAGVGDSGRDSRSQETRIGHLQRLQTPTLVLQGTRDPFGRPDDISRISLAPAIKLCWLTTGDHDLIPTRKSGLSQRDLLEAAAVSVSAFVGRLCGGS